VDQDNVVRVADFGLSRLYHGMHTMTGGLGTFQVGTAAAWGRTQIPEALDPKMSAVCVWL